MPFSADRVRTYRETKGASREDLALAIGRSYPSIALYESGAVTPPSHVVERIARYLDVSIDDLFEAA